MVWTRSSVVTVFVIRTRLTSCSQTPVLHLLGVVVARVFPGALQLTLVSHSSCFCLLTDSGRPQHHGGCVQMVRRDFVGSGPLQAHQQLCSKHPGRGGTRCFYGETSLRGIILRDLWKSGTPNISCKLTVLHILYEPQHIPTHVPGQVAHNIHSHSSQLDVQIYGPFGHVGGAGFSLLANCVKLYVLEQTEIIDREHSRGEIQQKNDHSGSGKMSSCHKCNPRNTNSLYLSLLSPQNDCFWTEINCHSEGSSNTAEIFSNSPLQLLAV